MANKKIGKVKNTRTRVYHDLEPLYDVHSKVLLLGSMPSPKSRETGFYYGHPQNRFWKVLAHIFNENVPETIPQKKTMLQKHHIALWDVLESCTIVGASDTSIADIVPNDIAHLVKNSEVRRIFCTGATAYRLYQKYCAPSVGLSAQKLPSTSPFQRESCKHFRNQSYLPWFSEGHPACSARQVHQKI